MSLKGFFPFFFFRILRKQKIFWKLRIIMLVPFVFSHSVFKSFLSRGKIIRLLIQGGKETTNMKIIEIQNKLKADTGHDTNFFCGH